MRKWLPLLTVSLSTFMLLLDVTIVSVAVPAMADALDSSFTDLQWTVDIYVLVLAALLMAIGSASDLFGRRRIFLLGLVVFAAASLACGLAPNIGFLIAARGMQGLGAAAMFATNAALLSATYRGRDLGVAFGVWGAVNGAAAALGPIVGGLLTEHISWRAIFLVNLPVAAVAIVIALRAVTESRDRASGRIDIPGTVTFTLGVSLLIYGLIEAGDQGWSDFVTLGCLIGAAVALVVFVLVERGRRAPMLDPRLFRGPSFSALMLGGFVLTGAAFANLVFVSVWAQTVLDFDPVKAGLVLTPLAGMSFVVAGAGGRLLHGVPPRISIGAGLLFVGAGTLLDMVIAPSSGWTALLAGLIVTGVGVGLASPVLASAALTTAPPERAGMANGAMNTFRQLGFAVGVPVFGTALAGQARATLSDSGQFDDPQATASALSGGGAPEIIARVPAAARAAVDQALHAAYADGLDRVFLISGAAALVAGVAVLLLVRPVPTAPRAAAADGPAGAAVPGGPAIPAPGGSQLPTGANG
ncbi:multidrug MFS transporter [Parafrankia soli]|uniref:Multidrug MFS transporter n=1 Tax=Parafrankia soli TaxID=2599596 RepID=A0A1S1QAL4_9ACTN|nr:MFS transporter [Parafrankia soli]OHV30255.1 multidrug MFS transporter [Parafrankia soli]